MFIKAGQVDEPGLFGGWWRSDALDEVATLADQGDAARFDSLLHAHGSTPKARQIASSFSGTSG